MRCSLFISFLFLSITCWTQNSHPIHTSLTGDELLEALVRDYKTSSTMSYGMARDTLYGIIDIRNDSIECVYSGHQVYLQPGQDPTTFLFNDGDQDGINAEHVYPRSAGADFGNALSDMHNIFPCRIEVNTNRGSFPFAEINDQETDSWYLNNQELNQVPSCLLYTSPSPRDATLSRMPSSA